METEHSLDIIESSKTTYGITIATFPAPSLRHYTDIAPAIFYCGLSQLTTKWTPITHLDQNLAQ